MATPISATAPRTRTAPRPGVLVATILAVISAGVLALAIWSSLGASSAIVTVESHPYGLGYPLHGGLAGPSRVSVFDQHPDMNQAGHYGVGYPLHGGLAGPSQLDEGD